MSRSRKLRGLKSAIPLKQKSFFAKHLLPKDDQDDNISWMTGEIIQKTEAPSKPTTSVLISVPSSARNQATQLEKVTATIVRAIINQVQELLLDMQDKVRELE